MLGLKEYVITPNADVGIYTQVPYFHGKHLTDGVSSPAPTGKSLVRQLMGDNTEICKVRPRHQSRNRRPSLLLS